MSEQQQLTPDEWLEFPEFADIVVHDPDGWDRQNFSEDWERPLTRSEFIRKLAQCTVGPRR